jgi:hypothetical protein
MHEKGWYRASHRACTGTELYHVQKKGTSANQRQQISGYDYVHVHAYMKWFGIDRPWITASSQDCCKNIIHAWIWSTTWMKNVCVRQILCCFTWYNHQQYTVSKDYSVMIDSLQFVDDTTGVDRDNESEAAGHLLRLRCLVVGENLIW